MKIGILQCGHTPDPVRAIHGDFDDMFRALFDGQGFDFRTWNVVDMEFPNGPDDADGWLVTGSKFGAYEDHAFIAPLEGLLRAIYASDKRMVGICFGHQIIAQALGGQVEKFAGGWAVGRRAYEMDGLGPIHLNAWHQDQVTVRPDQALPVATNDFTENAALVYGDRIFTVQPHPELSNPIIASYLDAREGDATYPDGMLAHARAENAKPTDDARLACAMALFLREGRLT